MAVSPYGFWRSPVTSDFVVADSIRLEQVALDGEVSIWSEGKPQKKGRSFIYRMAKAGEAEPVTPDDGDGFSVRTRVHEYGGGSFAVSDGVVYFSNDADQRLYRQDGGGNRGRSRLRRPRAAPMACATQMGSSTGVEAG